MVYEQPIMNSYQNFLKAFFKHYSSLGTTTGQQIAPYILYARVGMSKGGENYAVCALNNTPPPCVPISVPCNVGTANSTWPGPLGQFLSIESWQSQFSYSDAGYLTQWNPLSGDGVGYMTTMLQFLNSYATFPVTIASSNGPPGHGNGMYADLEAELADQNNVGFGNQVLSIADSTLAASGNRAVDNWVANFKNYPYAPVHHLQLRSPGGGGMFAAGFAITSIGYSSGTGLATVSCAAMSHCEIFSSASIYITGNQSPTLNGVFQTLAASGVPDTVTFIPNQPPPGAGPYTGGNMWGPSYWPITMPFATQQKVTAVEAWECDIDFAFGTTSTSGCIITLPTPDSNYENTVVNTLLGLPSGTSFHTDTLYNGWQY